MEVGFRLGDQKCVGSAGNSLNSLPSVLCLLLTKPVWYCLKSELCVEKTVWDWDFLSKRLVIARTFVVLSACDVARVKGDSCSQHCSWASFISPSPHHLWQRKKRVQARVQPAALDIGIWISSETCSVMITSLRNIHFALYEPQTEPFLIKHPSSVTHFAENRVCFQIHICLNACYFICFNQWTHWSMEKYSLNKSTLFFRHDVQVCCLNFSVVESHFDDTKRNPPKTDVIYRKQIVSRRI